MATRIPYLDEVWNVTTGCGDDMVSPGCHNCYARRMFGRNLWRQPCPECSSGEFWDGDELVVCSRCDGFGTIPQTFTPTFHADRLEQPLHWRKPRVVGVSFMGDWAHPAFSDSQIMNIFGVMAAAPQHEYLFLTKRPERQKHLLQLACDKSVRFRDGTIRAWAGVTVCNQEEADRNIPLLLDTPAAVRWVSLEPMLGPVDLDGGQARSGGYLLHTSNYIGLPAGRPRFDLVVLGGESGPGARPMKPDWALDVYRQCKAAGVAFWFKSMGTAPHKKVWDWPNTLGAEMQATHELPAALAEAVAP